MLPHETIDIKEKSNLPIKEADNIGVLYGIINSNAEIKVKIIHKFKPSYVNEYNVWIVGTDDYDILVDGSNLNTIPGTKHYVIYGSFDEYGVTKYYDKSRSDIILYGLINYKGVDLTGPKYSRIRSPLKNGVRISIKPDSGSSVMEHMGILDHNGKEITEFKYTKILPLEDNEDLYKLVYTNKSSMCVTEYCDYKGNIYSDVDDALASLKKEKYIKEENGGVSTTFGFINSDGDIILPIIYKRIRKPNDANLYMINNGISYAIFDNNLNQLSEFVYADEHIHFNRFGTAKLRKGKIGDSMYTVLIDKDGNELTNTENIYTYIYNSNSFGVRRALKQANDGYFYWGLLGNDGNEIIEFKYDSIKPMHIDGTYEMKMTENDKSIYEYCNYRGKIFDTPEDAIKSMDEQINENNIPVLKRFGIIESSCKFIIPIEYNDIVHVKRIDRYIITNEHFQDALFDENLNKLTDFFYSIRRFEPIHNTAIFLKDKLGTMDADGNIITPPIYVSISEPDIYGTRIARYESIQSFGLLDKNGHEITEFIYRNIDKIAPEVIDYNGVYKLYELYEEGTHKITYASHRGNIYNAVSDAIKDNKIVEDEQINENNIPELTKFGIIESSCKFIIPIKCYKIVHEKRIDRYIIRNEHFKQALFDENLNRLTKFFYSIRRFDPIHNTAIFEKDKFGTMDADGNVVISPKYFSISEPDVYGTRIAKYEPSNSHGLVDKNGNEITKFIYDFIDKIDTEVVQYSGGVYKLFELREYGQHKLTYASHRGNIYDSIVDAIKDDKIVESISNGFIVESTLEKNKVKYDIINKDCHLYGDFEFDSIYTDNIGNLIYSSGDLWGILNPNLDRLFDIRAYSISNFWGIEVGVYRCNIINGKTLIYDSIKDIVSQEYDYTRTFIQTNLKIINENIFIVSRNNKWAICDSNFKEITKMVYDDISGMLLDDSGVTIAKKGTHKGLLDIYTGKQLTKIIYDNISFNPTDKIITLKITKSSNPKTHYYHINTGELNDTY